MAFKGRDPVRTKTVIRDNEIIEQVKLFNCLGNISYEGEVDIDNKLNNFLKIISIMCLDHKKPIRKQELNYTTHQPFQSCYMAAKLGLLKQVTPEE